MLMRARPTFSRKLTDAIDRVRADFNGFTQGFEALTTKRATIAPVFASAFHLWQRETGRSFVAFVRELDHRLPADRRAYVAHPSYQAARYLKSLAVNGPKVAGRGVSPFRLLAITIKSFFPLLKSRQDEVFALLAHASHWRDRDVTRLRDAVRRAKPVPLPGVPRVVPKRTLRPV